MGETTDPVTEEKLKQIQKEIQEQEVLLQGYQQVWLFNTKLVLRFFGYKNKAFKNISVSI